MTWGRLRDGVIVVGVREPGSAAGEPGQPAFELWPELIEMTRAEAVDCYEHHQRWRGRRGLRAGWRSEAQAGGEEEEFSHARMCPRCRRSATYGARRPVCR